MTARVRVGGVEEFDEDGARKLVSVEGTSVGVIHVDGEFYALENRCAHQHGPLCSGTIKPAIVGEFVGTGQHVEERFADHHTISCPYHGWEYDIRTGEHVGDENIAVETYETSVEDGEVYIEV